MASLLSLVPLKFNESVNNVADSLNCVTQPRWVRKPALVVSFRCGADGVRRVWSAGLDEEVMPKTNLARYWNVDSRIPMIL